jgi:hypothetical protein
MKSLGCAQTTPIAPWITLYLFATLDAGRRQKVGALYSAAWAGV